jgi:hypothetical protein
MACCHQLLLTSGTSGVRTQNALGLGHGVLHYRELACRGSGDHLLLDGQVDLRAQ